MLLAMNRLAQATVRLRSAGFDISQEPAARPVGAGAWGLASRMKFETWGTCNPAMGFASGPVRLRADT